MIDVSFALYIQVFIIDSLFNKITGMKDRTLIAKHILGKSSQPRQRLQFPQITQQRKHFHSKHEDQVRFGTEQNQNVRYTKHNKLDISDIEGAKPRVKQETTSQKKRVYTLESDLHTLEPKEELEKIARKSLSKRDHSLQQLNYPKGRYWAIEPPLSFNNILGVPAKAKENKNGIEKYQHLRTESITNDYSHGLDKYKMVEIEQQPARVANKRSILQNPTYISSLIL